MNELLPWKIISEKTVYSTPWCTVKEETVELPNGDIIDEYSIIELPDVVMIFPLTKDNRVIMVRQYRHGAKKVLMELPAGTYDKNEEAPKIAAQRELQEETGYKTDELVFLGTVYEYPTKDRHSISIYFADDITPETTTFKEATKEIEVVEIPLDELESYIQRREIAVSGTIAAIHLAKEYLEKRTK